MTRITALAIALIIPVLGLTAPADAGDVQGDAYECQDLWVMRNQVYKDNGYCFTSARAISYFGIGGCSVTSEADLPLSKSERNLVREVRASERRQSC